MSKTKKFLVAFLCAVALLFLVACASIIMVFVVGYTKENASESIIGVVYLFLYLLATAYIFYQVFRAFLTKPQILSVVMIDERGQIIKKSVTTTLVLMIISGLLFAFSFAIAVGLDKVLPIFSKAVSFAIMNTSLAVFTICLFFHIYPKFHDFSLIIKER